MTRPRRVAVEKISAPHAEISTAGVIIAVSTASAFAGASSRDSQSTMTQCQFSSRSLCDGCRCVASRGSDLPPMKAILVREFGGPEVCKLEDVPDPVPGPGQVLVRVHAAGVNPFDTYMRTRQLRDSSRRCRTRPAPMPRASSKRSGADVPGSRSASRVYIGGTAAHKSYGAYAEKVLCEPQQVHPLPDRLSFAQGAGVNVPYVTAWRALHDRARIQPGETLFIHGASGGVGPRRDADRPRLGPDRHRHGRHAEGLELVRAQGAHHALNHREAGYLDALKDLTGGRGPDVILENLANVNLDNDLTRMAHGGRVVVVGNRGRIEIDPRKTMGKDGAIVGMALWNTQRRRNGAHLRAHRCGPGERHADAGRVGRSCRSPRRRARTR